MKATLQKWGNSLGVRIPATVARAPDLKLDSVVDLQIEDGKIVLIPQRKKKRYELSDLLGFVTPNNQPKGNITPSFIGKDTP